MRVELMPLDQAVAEADFLTVHLPKTKETTGLINADLLAKAKPSCGSSTWLAAASSTRPAIWPTRFATASSPVRRSTCSPPSR
jgi:hypothetical protein